MLSDKRMTGWWDSLADLYVNCRQLLSFVYFSSRCRHAAHPVQSVWCGRRLHGKLLGGQDRGGQGMNERGAILQRREKETTITIGHTRGGGGGGRGHDNQSGDFPSAQM